jgi:O-antigen/teichoic acid export membrane protein
VPDRNRPEAVASRRMASEEPSIGARTVRGMFWAYGSFVAGRSLTLVSTAILARLLDPRDFGLVALALVFTAFLETVADLGLSQALVVTPDAQVLERADTVFLASIGLGAALTAVVAGLGPVTALFFHQSALSWLMGLLGMNFLLRALGSTHYALAEKRIDFRARTRAEVADVAVRGVVSIALAVAGLGAASIVLGYLAGTIALSATLWIVVPWRPRLRARRDDLRALVRFSAAYSGVDAVVALSNNVDYVFVGRVLGPAALGLYSLGFRLPELLILNLSLVAGRVLFPAFAAIASDALADAFLVAFRYTMMVALPLAAGLAALSHPLILALFGDKWEGSVGAMRVLSLYALFLTVNIPAGTAYKATRRPQVLLALAIPRFVVLVVSIAVLVDRGIVAVAACQAGAAGVVALLSTVLAARLLAVRPGALLGELWAPLLAAALTGAALLVVQHTLPRWPALLAGVVVGAVVYIGVLWVVKREDLEHLWRRLRPAGPHHLANT